jgi:hypothetical protein
MVAIPALGVGGVCVGISFGILDTNSKKAPVRSTARDSLRSSLHCGPCFVWAGSSGRPLSVPPGLENHAGGTEGFLAA